MLHFDFFRNMFNGLATSLKKTTDNVESLGETNLFFEQCKS